MALKIPPPAAPAIAAPAPAEAACQHCHTLFRPAGPDDTFCCGGCAFVYDLITGSGLKDYYSLKGRQTTPPVKNTAFHQRDHRWLTPRIAAAEAAAGEGAATLDCAVQGISCVGCVWLLEKLYQRQPGALRARVRAHPGRIRLEWKPGQHDPAAFAEAARQFGYLLGSAESAPPVSQAASSRMGLCGAFAMNAMAFSLPRYLGMEDSFALAPIFLMAAATCATLAVLTGGSYFINRAWHSLRAGVLHMDLPIAIGILAAYLGSLAGWLLQVPGLIYFDFVAVFTFLMLAGRRLQLSAVERNRGRLLGASLLTGSVQGPDGQSIDLTEITPGTIYQLLPGQIVPTASRLLSGEATISLESISGEADPRHLTAGGRLPSGSLHTGRAPLTLESLETWEASLYRRLRDTRETEARHPWLDRILRYYILTVLTLAILGGLAWWIHSGHAATGLQVMISLLVVSCPCALGVALPLADDLAAAAMERIGVFIRRPIFWPRLLKVRHILFDKTGTLTLESPALGNPAILQHLDAASLTALKTLIHDSLHPVSRSLTEALAREHGPLAREFTKAAGDPRDKKDLIDQNDQNDVTPPPAPTQIPTIKEIPGCGLSLTDNSGQTWTLGHPTWDGISHQRLTLPAAPWSNHPADAVLRHNGTLLAQFRFKDTIRPETRDTLAVLQRQGYTLHILSGDRSEKVTHLADKAGIPRDGAIGNLSPAEKATAVRDLDQHDTLYLGDGANDSLAFDEAYCTGTPVVDKGVLENRADFYFLGRSLGFISTLLTTAHQRQRAVRRTAAFALLYNASAGLLCLAGLMNPLLAAILMPLSSVVTLAIVALHFRRRA
jgi:Cu2+-exporting ATPase